MEQTSSPSDFDHCPDPSSSHSDPSPSCSGPQPASTSTTPTVVTTGIAEANHAAQMSHATATQEIDQPALATRVILLGSGLGLLVLLLVARMLTPSESGLGTHQQLGLPPCSMRVMFGVRCPGCGMTTSWSHFTRGDWPQSVRSNAAGFGLAWLAIVAAPILIRSAWLARPLSHVTQITLTASFVIILGLSVIQWAWRLAA